MHSKESILLDAKQTLQAINATIARISGAGYGALTDKLSILSEEIVNVTRKLANETSSATIHRFELTFLQLKNKAAFETQAVDSLLLQVQTLTEKAAILLEQIRGDIATLQEHNKTSKAELLRIDEKQLALFQNILQSEKIRDPIQYAESLLSTVEHSVLRTLMSTEIQIERDFGAKKKADKG